VIRGQAATAFKEKQRKESEMSSNAKERLANLRLNLV